MKKQCARCGGEGTVGKLFDLDTIYFCEECFRELYPDDSEWFMYGEP